MGRSWQKRRRDSLDPDIGDPISKRQTGDNPFQVLEDLDMEDGEITKKVADPPIPPIFLPGVENVNNMIKDVKKLMDSAEFTYRAMPNGDIKICVQKIYSYRELVKFMDTNKVEYHTYQLKSERSFRVLMKGIHHTFPFDDIKEELEKTNGIKVRQINKVINRRTQLPYPATLFLDLEHTAEAKSIYNINNIYGALMTIEAPNIRNAIPQCTRCQLYGHTKNFCRRPYACVKCSGDHPTINCPKPKSTPAKCFLCGLAYTANYKGCQHYQNLIQNRYTENRSPLPAQNRPPPPPPVYQNPNYQTPNQSYAQVATEQPQSSASDRMQQTLDAINHNLTKQQDMMSSMMAMLSTVINKLLCRT